MNRHAALRGLLRRLFGERLLPLRAESGHWLWYPPAEHPSLLRGMRRIEPAEARRWRALLRAGDTIYDVGANIGLTVHRFFGLLRGDCSIVAFEPIPRNADLLERNARALGPRVAVERCAIGEREGTIAFRENLEHGALSNRADLRTGVHDAALWHGQAEIEVPMQTLDGFARRSGRTPDFIKLDVEGAGHLALRGAPELLGGARPILSCSLHNKEEEGGILEVVRAAGYRGVALGAGGALAWCELAAAAGNYVHPESAKASRVGPP